MLGKDGEHASANSSKDHSRSQGSSSAPERDVGRGAAQESSVAPPVVGSQGEDVPVASPVVGSQGEDVPVAAPPGLESEPKAVAHEESATQKAGPSNPPSDKGSKKARKKARKNSGFPSSLAIQLVGVGVLLGMTGLSCLIHYSVSGSLGTMPPDAMCFLVIAILMSLAMLCSTPELEHEVEPDEYQRAAGKHNRAAYDVAPKPDIVQSSEHHTTAGKHHRAAGEYEVAPKPDFAQSSEHYTTVAERDAAPVTQKKSADANKVEGVSQRPGSKASGSHQVSEVLSGKEGSDKSHPVVTNAHPAGNQQVGK